MGRGLSERTKRIVDLAYRVLEAEHPMTLRQLFYRLVSVKALENRQTDYQRLSRIMTGARRRGEVPFEWMVDRSRPEYEPNVWSDPAGYAEAIQHSYRRDYWKNQPWHVEVWSEKDTVGSILPLLDDYGIILRTARGFQSTTLVKNIADLFERLTAAGKQIEVLYLGDHDPSGLSAEESVASRVAEFIKPSPAVSDFHRRAAKLVGVTPEGVRDAQMLEDEAPDLQHEVWAGRIDLDEAMRRLRGRLFQMRRLAIHREDIRAFDLPPVRIKTSDSRSASFLRKQPGPECVELDALPPSELRARLESAITERIDRDKWDRAVMVESAELESIRTIASNIGNIMKLHE